MKKLAVVLSMTLALFVGAILIYRWDSDTNHGFVCGYYGEFNRVSNALASIPGLVVTQSWANCDVSLEEFGFRVTNPKGQPVHIVVSEQDDLRTMSGLQLTAALLERLQSQSER